MTMSRADDVRAAYAAELALAEAEDQLVRLKESGTPEELADQKHQVRELRRAFREERSGASTAAPETVSLTVGVGEVG
jgi:hypothetical protein